MKPEPGKENKQTLSFYLSIGCTYCEFENSFAMCTTCFSLHMYSCLRYNIAGDSFTDDIRRQVEAIKRDRGWEAKFMLLEEMMRDERAEGRKIERARMNRLIKILSEQNRLDDIVKAASDSEYQEALFKEFNL